jgi:hypothetical protein
MGFGVGSTIWTNVGNSLMTSGYATWQIMGIFAAIFLGGLTVSLPFMRLPNYRPGKEIPNAVTSFGSERSVRGAVVRFLSSQNKRNVSLKQSMHLKDAVRTFEFFALIIMVFGQFIAGVVRRSSSEGRRGVVGEQEGSRAHAYSHWGK